MSRVSILEGEMVPPGICEGQDSGELVSGLAFDMFSLDPGSKVWAEKQA